MLNLSHVPKSFGRIVAVDDLSLSIGQVEGGIGWAVLTVMAMLGGA